MSDSSATGAPSSPRAWALIAAGPVIQYGGHGGYDDEPSSYYSWDSRVPRHAEIRAGDRIALRDKKVLLGISVVEEVVASPGMKDVFRCPSCGKGTISRRATMDPPWICNGTGGCEAEFAQPVVLSTPVTTYWSRHDAAWADLYAVMTAAEVKALCEKPGAQHSIQPLSWNGLLAVLRSRGEAISLSPVEQREAALAGGHTERTVRVRVGQAAFRKRLLEQYGAVCAFTGPAPEAALEAAHLYSFAALGEHHQSGGLMLRSDVHVLFDQGLLAVNPATGVIDVHESIAFYDTYGKLHGGALHAVLSASARKWLALHWQMHRGRVP